MYMYIIIITITVYLSYKNNLISGKKMKNKVPSLIFKGILGIKELNKFEKIEYS